MDKHKEQDQLLNQLFREQRAGERKRNPSFAELYGKAQQKHQKMKNIKLIVTVAIGLVLLAGLAILMTDKEQGQNNIQVAKAGIAFYESLQTEGKFVVHDIYFDYDQATLKSESMAVIQTIANMMEAHPEVRLSVEGHTDSQGSFSYNEKLSATRAAAVRDALISQGIDGNRLKAAGKGESQPVADNSSDAGRSKNRRVEFVGF